MATLEITLPPAEPGGETVRLSFDDPLPPPEFIEMEDGDGNAHRYVRAEWLPIEMAPHSNDVLVCWKDRPSKR